MKTQRINKYVWTFYTKTSENTLWVLIHNIGVPRFPLLHRFFVSFRKIIRPIDEISKILYNYIVSISRLSAI